MKKFTSFRSGFLLTIMLLSGLAASVALSPIIYANTITVDTTDDEVNDDGDCSLREAIIAANTNAPVDECAAGDGDDIITVPPGTYLLTVAGAGEDDAQTGDLDLTANITINGAGRNDTVIDGNGLDRVFEIPGDVIATINEVTVQNGEVTGNGGGISISFNGELTLADSRVTASNASGSGGGIYSGGSLTLSNSRIDGNEAGSAGGGLVVSFQPVTVTNSEISGNSAGNNGGGIYSTGELVLVNSTLSGNSANLHGGGFYSIETNNNHMYNVTITDNTADADQNDQGNGGGVSVLSGLNVANTIISGNTDSSNASAVHHDCSGTLNSQGYNLVTDINGCNITDDTTGNLIGADPSLGPLQNNGGTTFTHALLTGSPAIDAGNVDGCRDHDDNLLTTDQRGFTRPATSGSGCDMGAYEADSAGVPTPTPTLVPTATSEPAPPLDKFIYLPLVLR